ncbi:hypothetical protein ACFVHS_45930 [Streptomyces sp. NPDC057746]|uniref:hypothetical protein n=1 Tax=Streptomyces sp. NPDC057746 TaxID=3346237 RepID=UPI0036839E80
MSKTPPLDREAKRRLAFIRHVEEVTGNVAMSGAFPRSMDTICYAAAVSVTDRCSKAIGLM